MTLLLKDGSMAALLEEDVDEVETGLDEEANRWLSDMDRVVNPPAATAPEVR